MFRNDFRLVQDHRYASLLNIFRVISPGIITHLGSSVFMDYLYTLVKFLAAGTIIVGVTLIVHLVDPRYGGILAAAPITTTIAFIFTYSETGNEVVRQLVLGSCYFAIPSLIFLAALYLLLNRFPFVSSLCGAYLIWICGVFLMNRVINTI